MLDLVTAGTEPVTLAEAKMSAGPAATVAAAVAAGGGAVDATASIGGNVLTIRVLLA